MFDGKIAEAVVKIAVPTEMRFASRGDLTFWYAQIAIALLWDSAKAVFATCRMLLGDQPDPGREIASRRECFPIPYFRD
jgi:hypothetical protein